MRRVYLAVALCVALIGCGDKICDAPTGINQTKIGARLSCPNGATTFSIAGPCYAEATVKEQRTFSSGCSFIVVPDTKYTVSAKTDDGALIGSVTVVSPGPGKTENADIACD